MTKLEEGTYPEKLRIKQYVVAGKTRQKLIMILWTDWKMYEDTPWNLFNEVLSIKNAIALIKGNDKIIPENLELSLITFKWSPVAQENIEELISLWVKQENISFYSGGVWTNNFDINDTSKIKNMPHYSRKNTASSVIKLIDYFTLNVNKDNSIVIWRWKIWSIISLKYWWIEKTTSNNKEELLKAVKWKKNIIITTSVTEDNKWFLDKDFLKLLPEWANIINASRKELVNTRALIRYVEDKKIRYYSDVYEWETEQDPKHFDNVIYIKNWKIIKREKWKETIISKQKLEWLKSDWKVQVFLTPHIFWRWGYKEGKEPWRKFYEYRKILWMTEKPVHAILEEIEKVTWNEKTFIDIMTK